MGKVDYRRVKRGLSYSVDELARLCGVHKNSIRTWQRKGLEPIDGGRPVLFYGETVRAWLTKRRAAARSPCPPGTLYCFRCRAPRPPALGMAEFVPMNTLTGNIRAFCGSCEALMHRRASHVRLPIILPGIDVQIAQPEPRLRDSPAPSPNSDLARKGRTQ